MKQKKGAIWAVLGVILLLFIAGCDDGVDPGGAPRNPFIGGSQGLEIGFLEGLPPDEVTDDKTFEFQAMLKLKNLGEYNLKKDEVNINLIGFQPTDFGISAGDMSNKNPDDDLTPKQRDSEGNIIEAVETFVTFPSKGSFNFQNKLAGNTPFIFRADVCYKYQTKTVSEICILENMIDVADDAICSPSGSKSVFSSGSPIQINSFRQNVIGKNKVQFSFDISHVGKGSVFELAEKITDGCPKDAMTRRTKEDKVKVLVNTGIQETLNCVGLDAGNGEASGPVKLVNGKRTMTCTQELPASRSDFRTLVNIVLDFDYLDKVDTEVLVKHLLEDST